MKGISIAMETIVYIILAVLVLTILLYFFTSQAGPAQDRTRLEEQRSNLCGLYSQQDVNCNNMNAVDASTRTSLLGVCGKLTEPSCAAGQNYDAQKCIQNCCFTCPRAT